MIKQKNLLFGPSMSDSLWRQLSVTPAVQPVEERPQPVPPPPPVRVWTRLPRGIPSSNLPNRLLSGATDGRTRDSAVSAEGQALLRSARPVLIEETGSLDLRNPPKDPSGLAKLWVLLCCLGALLAYALKRAAAALGLKAPGFFARSPEALSTLFMLGMPLPLANPSRESLVGARRVLSQLSGPRSESLIRLSHQLQSDVEELELLNGALATVSNTWRDVPHERRASWTPTRAYRRSMDRISAILEARQQRVQAFWRQGEVARLTVPRGDNHLAVVLLTPPVDGRSSVTLLEVTQQGCTRTSLGDRNLQNLVDLELELNSGLQQVGNLEIERRDGLRPPPQDQAPAWCRPRGAPPVGRGGQQGLPSPPGAAVIGLLEEVAQALGTPHLEGEALALWKSNTCLALMRELGRGMMIGSSFLRVLLSSPAHKLVAPNCAMWTLSIRRLIGELERGLETATAGLRVPVAHPWSRALHSLAESCIVQTPTALMGPSPVSFAPPAGGGMGETAQALEIERLVHSQRANPARTVELTARTLRDALQEASAPGSLLIRRGRLFARLEALDVAGVWPALSGCSGAELQALRQQMAELRTAIHLLGQQTLSVSMEQREWLAMQKLACLEGEVCRLRVDQIQSGETLTRALQESKQIIESHPMGGLFWRDQPLDGTALTNAGPLPQRIPASPVNLAARDHPLASFEHHHAILALAASLESGRDPRPMLQSILPEMQELLECIHLMMEHKQYLSESLAHGYLPSYNGFAQPMGGWARSNQSTAPAELSQDWEHPAYRLSDPEKAGLHQLWRFSQGWFRCAPQKEDRGSLRLLSLEVLAGTRSPRANWLQRVFLSPHWGTIRLAARFSPEDAAGKRALLALAAAQLRRESHLQCFNFLRDLPRPGVVPVHHQVATEPVITMSSCEHYWGKASAPRHPYLSQVGSPSWGRPYLPLGPRPNSVAQWIRGSTVNHQRARGTTSRRQGPLQPIDASYWHDEMRRAAANEGIELQDSDLLAARAVSLHESHSTRLHQVMGLIANYPGLLERPWFPGLFVRATLSEHLTEPVDPASGVSLARILNDILTRASQEVLRNPVRAAGLCAWAARALPHLPPEDRNDVLEALRAPQERLDDRSLLDALVAQLPRLPLPAQHSLLHMTMVLDSVMQNGQSLLAAVSTPEMLLSLRSELMRRGDTIVAWPADGPRAEWLRETRRIFLQHWLPSLSQLSQPDLQALEECVARQILQPGTAALERRVEGRIVHYRSTQAAARGELMLDLANGVVQMAHNTLPPPSVGMIPGLAFAQIPFLQQMVGERSCFETTMDADGRRCTRVVGSAADEQWIELVETLEGFRLRGRFSDPLNPRSRPELWLWAPHPPRGPEQPLPHALTHFGLWQSRDGQRTRLIASSRPLTPQARDCYAAHLAGGKVCGLERGGVALWPPIKRHGALGRLTRLEVDCRVEGGSAAEPSLMRFPSLHGMEIERVRAPKWAHRYLGRTGMAYQVRDGQERLMWFPDGTKIAADLFGARFARSVMPLINEQGAAQLWIVPTRRARREANLPSLIKLDLTSANPDLSTLSFDQPEALVQAALFAAAHASAPIAFDLLRHLERAPAAALSEEQKAQLLEQLNRHLPESDRELTPLFQLRLSLLALRWGLSAGELAAQVEAVSRISPTALARLRNPLPGPDHLALMRAQLPSFVVDVIELRLQEAERLMGEPAAVDLAALPARAGIPLPALPNADLRLSPPTQERLDGNRQPLSILYATVAPDHTLGRLYRRSLQTQLDLRLPSPEEVGRLDAALRQWAGASANREAIQRGAQEAERQASQQRDWILAAIQHLNMPQMHPYAAELRRGARGHEAAALSQLIRLWSQGALRGIHLPGGGPERAGLSLNLAIEHYLQASCTATILRKIEAAGQDPARLRISIEQLRTFQPTLQDPLEGGDLQAVLNRHRLAMQAERGIVVRQEQIEAVHQILEPLAAGRNRAMQMRPGFGKTDIVMALALRCARDRGEDWTAVVPEQLLSTTRRGLGRSLEGLLTLHLDREELEGEEGIAFALRCSAKLRAARANHTPVLTTAESLATLEVAIAQRLGSGAPAREVTVLRDLRGQLRSGRMLMDEADAILAPNRKLIFALGERHAVPQQACDWMRHFMLRLGGPPRLGVGADGEVGEPASVVALKQAFAHQTTASVQVNDPERVKEATLWLVRQSLQDLGLPPESIELILGEQPIPEGHPLAALGPLVRQTLVSSLPQVFAGAVQREYGISPSRLIGVPFKEGEEETNTQFSHFADQLAFTFAAAAFQFPLDAAVLDERWWDTLATLRGEDLDPNSRPHQLARRLEALRQQAEQENLRHGGQSVAQILRRLAEQPENLDLRLEYAQKLLAPRIQVYKGSAHRRMSDIILGIDGVVGMTGTLRPDQLPPTFDAPPQDRCSSIEVHAALLKGNAEAVAASLPEVHHEAQAAQLLDDLVAPDASGEPRYQVVLNQACLGHRVGSRAIAERWARRYRRPVAFHDPHHRCPRRLMVPTESGELVETEFQDAPPESDVHARTLFYFGPADLRGVNFVIPKAKAVFLPSPTVTDDSLEQAVRRMRGLGSRHTVDLCLPYGVAQALTREGVAPTVQAWLRDVLRRTQEEERKLERGASDNDQIAQAVQPATRRWLEGSEPMQQGDLADTLDERIPLVAPTWSSADWRGARSAQQGERQVVRAVARQVAQALAIEASHIALPQVHWWLGSGLDDPTRRWKETSLLRSNHQYNAHSHGLPISQEALLRLVDQQEDRASRQGVIQGLDFSQFLSENGSIEAIGCPYSMLVGSAAELRQQERVLQEANVPYARVQQCLGPSLETARLRWEVVSASSSNAAALALRALEHRGVEWLVCGSTRRALEARAAAMR
jgi:hypothetical protein